MLCAFRQFMLLACLLTYLGIGVVWAIIMVVMLLDVLTSTKDALGCFIFNVFLWWFVLILFFVANHVLKRLDYCDDGYG